MDRLSTIQTEIAHRPYESFGSSYKSARTFSDFLVDGQSLADILKNRGFDLNSVLWAEGPAKARREAGQRLLRLKDADCPNDRRTLYVCAECGDIGCGAITILVDCDAETVTWREFGYENDYEPSVSHEKLRDLGPFVFSRDEYSRVLNDALSKIEELS
ncbi:MAG: hypothetical protein WAN12_20185 [Candidatus Acidiferrum sp.]